MKSYRSSIIIILILTMISISFIIAYVPYTHAETNITENTFEITVEKFNINSTVLHLRANIITKNKGSFFYIAYENTNLSSSGVLIVKLLPVSRYEKGILIDTSIIIPVHWNEKDFPLDNLNGIFYIGTNMSLEWGGKYLFLYMPSNYYEGNAILQFINESEKGLYHKNLKIGEKLFQLTDHWTRFSVSIFGSARYRFFRFMYFLPLIIVFLEIMTGIIYFCHKSKTLEFKKNLINDFLIPILISALISLPMFHLSITSAFKYAILVYFNGLIMPFSYAVTVIYMFIILYIQQKRK